MHGYGGSGALFFRIFKSLIEHFCVITIDIPGMGASARPNDANWKKITPQESNQYFIDKIERWRVAMGKEFYKNGEEFTGLYWMAHSFGGHVSGQYVMQYPQHIKKIFFLSPIGIRAKQPQEISEDEYKNKQRPPFWFR
jgi:abhydrolase domain-containing protein 6